MDHHTRTEKYRPWNKVSHCRICTRKRQHCCEKTDEPHFNCSTDSGTFITSAQGMGYPPKTFIDSNSDGDILPHIPNLEDYCRTCMSRKARWTCNPMSDWSVDLIDIMQPDCQNTDNNANKNDRDDRQDNPLPSDWSEQENIWSGKTYDKLRITTLNPVPMPPPIREDEESDWNKNLYPQNYRAKVELQVSPSKPPQIGLKALGEIQILIPPKQLHHKSLE